MLHTVCAHGADLRRTGATYAVPVTPPAPTARRERWAWRARLRRNPARYRIYRGVVGVFGTLLVLVGLLLGPFPGPGGIPLILGGLAVLASEFIWARRLLHRARGHATDFARWAGRQPLWLRLGGSLSLLLLVAGAAWGFLTIFGVPGLVPDLMTDLLVRLPGVDR